MTISYDVFADLNVVKFTYVDDVTENDTAESYLRYLADKEFMPSGHILIDQGHCSFSDADFQSMSRVAARLRPLQRARMPGSRTAIFAPRDVQFGISRLFQTVSASTTDRLLEVFRTREESVAFLDLNPRDSEVMLRLWSVGEDSRGFGST